MCEVLLVPMMLPNDLSKLKFLQPVSIMSLLPLGSFVACSSWYSAASAATITRAVRLQETW